MQDEHAARDVVIELLHQVGLTGGEFYTRIVDSFKVERIPAPIVLDDVTDQFKV
jgi:hypothetical protein